MRPQVHWLEHPRLARSLAIMPRPRPGDWLDDEIAGWRAEGIDVVVSLLGRSPRAWFAERSGALQAERDEFFSFPIADRGVPSSFPLSAALARQIVLSIGQGHVVAVHCGGY